ncbi:phosphonoacetaldehyde hydrolase [Oricola sp.]|uniref:phosphonoacetaldehyde hydrolase n=1 Tax=Oricola sp. TaxID=1979950 RepID=UPI003BAD3AF8
MQVKAVIFDWAGTLVDFGSIAPLVSIRRAFEESDIELNDSDIREGMGLSKPDHILQITRSDHVTAQWLEKHGKPFDDNDFARIHDVYRAINRHVASERGKLIDGALATVGALRARDLMIGTTTSYSRDILEPLLSVAKAQGFDPDISICADEVTTGRPAPLAVYQIMVTLGVFPPSSVIKVDDTPVGLMEGKAAGTWTVGISESGNGIGLSETDLAVLDPEERAARVQTAARELVDAGADYVIGSVAELPQVIDDINERLAEGERPELLEYEMEAA